MCDEGSKGINEQASYAATKLHQLYDKLEYKRQALGSIQNAPKPDKKVATYEHMWQTPPEFTPKLCYRIV